MRRLIDLVLFVLLMAGALWLMYWQNNRLDAAAVSTLAGALFGGAAVLLGNWINRSNEWQRAAEELDQRRAKLKRLIAAELVNVAAGYLGTKPLLDSALEHVSQIGGALPDAAFLARSLPRGMPLTDSLGAELLTLEEPAIDALTTLQSNMAITRMNLQEAADGEVRLGLLRLTALAEGLAHDMKVLAECFDHIAPTRKLALMDKPAELASSLLRGTASGQKAQPQRDEY